MTDEFGATLEAIQQDDVDHLRIMDGIPQRDEDDGMEIKPTQHATGGPLTDEPVDEIVERHDILLILRSPNGTRTSPRIYRVAEETGVILRTGYRTIDEARAFCEGYDIGLNGNDD